MTSAQVNTDQVLRTGRFAMGYDDYILAIQYFNQAIDAKPYLPQPYLYRSIAKYYLEDFSGAEADATKAIEINPFITDAWEVRGASRMSLGRFGGAEEDYAHILKEYPDNHHWMFNRALALANLKDYSRSDSILNDLISRRPDFDSAWLVRAGNMLEQGDTIRAIADVDSALTRNSANSNAMLMRYQLALKYEHDTPKALDALDRLIKVNPRETELYIARANLRYTADDYFGAMADYTYALQLDPDNEVATYNRALLRTEVLDIDNALADYTKLLQLDPDNDFALYQRAMIYADKGRYREAIDDLTRFIGIYPSLATTYFVRSQLYLNAGDQKRAKADYDRGRQLASANRPITRQNRHKTRIEINFEKSQKEAEEASESETLTPEEFERRLHRVIEVDPEAKIEARYENSSIRGKIQNRNFDVEIEPLMQLTFYPSPSELRRKTYYLKEVDDLNDSRILQDQLFVSAHPQAVTDEEDIQRHFRAIEYYNSYIATHTPRPIDYLARALEQITVKNYESALADIDRLIALSPDYAPAYMLRAQALYYDPSDDIQRATRLKMVMADLDKAVELSAANAVAWFNKGNIAFESGDYTSAILAYTRAIEQQPDMGEAFFNRGYANLRLGNPDAGIKDISKAGELGVVPAYNLLKKISR